MSLIRDFMSESRRPVVSSGRDCPPSAKLYSLHDSSDNNFTNAFRTATKQKYRHCALWNTITHLFDRAKAPTEPTSTMAASNGAPGATLSASEKYHLISSNLQEVLNKEIIEEVLNKNERPLRIYWGTATTGKPHCGYFVPMLKIAEFLAAGCNVKILLADVHGFLDNLKAPIELVDQRAKYYKTCITEALKAVGVDISRLEFVLGSTYQTTGESGAKYFMDLLRLSTSVSGHDATKAGSEVVKQVSTLR